MRAVEDLSILTRTARPPDAQLQYGTQSDQFAQLWQGVGTEAATRPLLLLLHGGYWRSNYGLQHMAAMAAALSDEGWTVANVEYRRIPGAPRAAVDDLQQALLSLPARITAHDGRVLAVGFSAGGQLALWLAAQRQPLLHAVMALAPVASLRTARELGLSHDAVNEFFGAAAQLAQWDPCALPPPVVPVSILHGTDDVTVPLKLSLLYQAAHPTARLEVLPRTGHFALIDPDSGAWHSVLANLRDMLGDSQDDSAADSVGHSAAPT